MGEAGLSLSGCWAFRKGHHCLGPESTPSWAVPHREPQDGERLSGLLKGPQGLGSGPSLAGLCCARGTGGFVLPPYLLTLWLQNGWGWGTVARRAESAEPTQCCPCPSASARGAGTQAKPSPGRDRVRFSRPPHPWGSASAVPPLSSPTPLLWPPSATGQDPCARTDLQTRESPSPGLRTLPSGGLQ